jgi:hypothetical protein
MPGSPSLLWFMQERYPPRIGLHDIEQLVRLRIEVLDITPGVHGSELLSKRKRSNSSILTSVRRRDLRAMIARLVQTRR